MQGRAGTVRVGREFPFPDNDSEDALALYWLHTLHYVHTSPPLSLLSFCGTKELNIEQHKKNQLKKFMSIKTVLADWNLRMERMNRKEELADNLSSIRTPAIVIPSSLSNVTRLSYA